MASLLLRRKGVDHAEITIFKEKIQVYFRRGDAIRINRAQDFKELRVGVVRGWSYGDDFDRGRAAGLFIVEEPPSDRQNFLKLQASRLDVVLAVAESGAELQRTVSGLDMHTAPYLENPTYLAFAKSARKQAFLQRFNQVLAQLRASGEYERIVISELKHSQSSFEK